MDAKTPYEYHKDVLGVLTAYLVCGRGECTESLHLISDRGLRGRMESGSIVRLRHNAPGVPALVRYDSLPQAWQELLVRKFGEPKRQVGKSLFEREYVREAKFFEELVNLKLPNGRQLNDADVDKYTTNASVLSTMNRIYKHRKLTWNEVCKMADDFRSVLNHTLPNDNRYLRQMTNALKSEGVQSIVSKGYGNKKALKVDDGKETLLRLLCDPRHLNNEQICAIYTQSPFIFTIFLLPLQHEYI